MMLQSSAKSALSFSSKYAEQSLHDSSPDKKRQSYVHCDDISHAGTEILSGSNFCGNADLNHMCKRRKLQKSTVVVFPVDSDIDGGSVPSIFESPPIKAAVVAEEKHDDYLGSENDDRVDSVIKKKTETDIRERAKRYYMNLNVCDEDNSLKELCIAVLRSNGLLEVLPERFNVTIGAVGSPSTSKECCRICGRSGSIDKMLICDNCEGAFHKSCCISRFKKTELLFDEWFCAACSNLEHKSSPEIYFGKSLRFGMTTMSAKRALGPIEYMLRYAEQHISRVRIGEAFQAEVPEWSGPSKDDGCIGEPLELDPVEFIASTCYNKIPKQKLTNWLQCREPLHDDLGKPIEGTMCSKWRRAPLYESQTDDWECFCSVLWDPRYSDCAAPQELETDEVLSQLKYIEQLKSRLDGKKKE